MLLSTTNNRHSNIITHTMHTAEAAGKLKKLSIIPVLFAVSACASVTDNGRSIGLSQSVPVSSTAFLKDVKTIVKERDYSYVSLAISNPQDLKQTSHPLPSTIEITTGSGFVIDNNGYVVTAAHVGVAKNRMVIATGPKGKKYRGRVVAVQKIGDMALIKLDNPKPLIPVNPVTNPCIEPGTSILSLGKPGLRRDVARVGTLSELRFGKPVRYLKYGYDEAMVLNLQTRRGESGGPVFDNSGALMGMIVSTLSSASGTYLNLAHAVPTPALAKFICTNTKCRPAWRKLIEKKLSACPASVVASLSNKS